MKVSAKDVLNFVVARVHASEDKPLRLGNVDFWHEIPDFPVAVCYDKPTSEWDAKAIQDDLNKITEEYWDEMVLHLQSIEAQNNMSEPL